MRTKELAQLIRDTAFSVEAKRTRDNSAQTTARARAWRSAADRIEAHYTPRQIITENKINSIPDMTPYMKDKLCGYIRNPPTEPSQLAQLASVQGLGAKRAAELIQNNITSVDQLHQPAILDTLPAETRAYLTRNPETNIPRRTMTSLDRAIGNVLEGVGKYKIAGSYRRKMPRSRDIDLIVYDITLPEVEQALQPLKLEIYARGGQKATGLIKHRSKWYKVDIMHTTPEQFPYFLLYLTGSRNFNIRMRQVAKDRGLLLNQRGLYRTQQGKKVRIPARSEQEIFDHLGMVYVEPCDRI
jgi:DNA polymerase/3'-5' exonuclease PolX